jgi:hypothetical protein
MNAQLNTSDVVERTDTNTNRPVVITDPVADQVPVDVTLIHETPMGGTVAVVDPLDEKIVHEALVGETITHEAPLGAKAGSLAALLNREESEHFRTRWNEIQGKFVDEPRSAVQQADALVSEVSGQITQMFANEHSSLEGQWKQGHDVSTEDLRQALQSYRSFFNRLVA